MEPLYAAQVVPYFLAATPQGLLERVLLVLHNAYLVAFDQTYARFSEPVGHDFVGYHRRAIIEDALGAIPAAVSGVTATFELNVTGGASHCELSYANVVLTESKIEKPTASIQEARFRESLAERMSPGLFDSPAPLPLGTQLWGVIAHGPGDPKDRTAGFARIVFPDRNGNHAGMPSIDLYARYPQLRPTMRDLPDIQLAPRAQPDADEPKPRLRPDITEAPTGSDDDEQ
jgi:hypothetical protein